MVTVRTHEGHRVEVQVLGESGLSRIQHGRILMDGLVLCGWSDNKWEEALGTADAVIGSNGMVSADPVPGSPA